jgi:hypothetical protein
MNLALMAIGGHWVGLIFVAAMIAGGVFAKIAAPARPGA